MRPPLKARPFFFSFLKNYFALCTADGSAALAEMSEQQRIVVDLLVGGSRHGSVPVGRAVRPCLFLFHRRTPPVQVQVQAAARAPAFVGVLVYFNPINRASLFF